MPGNDTAFGLAAVITDSVVKQRALSRMTSPLMQA
jgi:hypothetical protein